MKPIELTTEMQVFVLARYAQMYTPKEVLKQLKEEFGDDPNVDALALTDIRQYDPSTSQGLRILSPAMLEVYGRIRKKFLEDVTTIPVANQAYRLRRIQDIIDHPRYKNDADVVPKLLTQAAKEVGGAFTNTQKIDSTVNQTVTQFNVIVGSALDRVYGAIDEPAELPALETASTSTSTSDAIEAKFVEDTHPTGTDRGTAGGADDE
jgi:hypothetical protein